MAVITLPDLKEAHSEGAGYCLFCANREEDLPSPYASECGNCGHLAVFPAALILTFLHWIDLEDEGVEL